MLQLTSLTLLMAAAASAAPRVFELPNPKDLALAKRADGNVGVCKENACSDCPFFFGPGTGYPDCPSYDTAQLDSAGYPREDNGQMAVYMSFPEMDSGCKYIIRTPVVKGDGTCGRPALVAEGAICARLVLDSTFLAQFCCGIGDCGGAGLPSFTGSSAGGILVLHDAAGNAIEPQVMEEDGLREMNSAEKRNVIAARSAAPAVARAPAKVQKRCGNGDYVLNRSYQKAGQSRAVSPTVTCSQSESCNAQMDRSVTEERSISIETSVSDPFGIISFTVGFEFSESITQGFSATYMFGPGETGYVAFTPILNCAEGYFSGDCDNNGEVFESCTPIKAGESGMNGNLAGVIIRS